MRVYERDRKGSERKKLIVSYNVDATQDRKIPGHRMMQTVATDAGELVTGSPGSAPSTLLFVISIIIPGMVAHTFNPNIPEVGLCEFEATQGYAVRPCLKKQKRNCYCCCCFETGFHELALAGLELPK